jgi:diacylglycerol O-acyltransferase
MTTSENAHEASGKPLHVGDMEAVMWGIENDVLLRQTMTAVLVLDRSPDRDVLFERLDRASRTLPPLRHRLVEVPLRLSTPRWLVDPNFDLSYHLRWIAAPGDGSIDGALEYAAQSSMSAFDHARPLWMMTVVDGLQGGRAALLVKISHAVTDGVGSVAILALIGDLTREPRDLGPMPPVPESESDRPLELAAEALAHTRNRFLGFIGRSATSAARAIPAVLTHPRSSADTVRRNVRALARVMTPPMKSLSPLMTERRGWMRFAAIDVDLEGLRKAAKPRGCTVNDAFVTAVTHGFALYHERHGKPVERLQAAVAVNIRKAGDFSFGNRVRGESIAIPISADDPAAAMTAHHDLIKAIKEEVKLPSATALDTVLSYLGPTVAPLFGVMMKHDDFAISNVPAGDQAVYVAGAKVVGLYPFGPLMGTAANCSLVGYDHQAFVGINADAAAVPDVHSLAACIREGFDAVLSLADRS